MVPKPGFVAGAGGRLMTRKPKRPKGGRQGLPPEAARRFHDHLATYVAAVAGRDELKRPKRAAFAERAGLRPKTVDSWFAGRAPDLPTLVQVAQEVGWSLDGMLLDRGDLQWAKPQTDPHEQLRELVMAALTPRVSGTDHATLALCVPDGRELVRLLAN